MVELVSKLQELGFLDGDLLHSINGREYLTPEHLRAEVLQAVERSGGRVAVVRSSSRLTESRARALSVLKRCCVQVWCFYICRMGANVVGCTATYSKVVWLLGRGSKRHVARHRAAWTQPVCTPSPRHTPGTSRAHPEGRAHMQRPCQTPLWHAHVRGIHEPCRTSAPHAPLCARAGGPAGDAGRGPALP